MIGGLLLILLLASATTLVIRTGGILPALKVLGQTFRYLMFGEQKPPELTAEEKRRVIQSAERIGETRIKEIDLFLDSLLEETWRQDTRTCWPGWNDELQNAVPSFGEVVETTTQQRAEAAMAEHYATALENFRRATTWHEQRVAERKLEQLRTVRSKVEEAIDVGLLREVWRVGEPDKPIVRNKSNWTQRLLTAQTFGSDVVHYEDPPPCADSVEEMLNPALVPPTPDPPKDPPQQCNCHLYVECPVHQSDEAPPLEIVRR